MRWIAYALIAFALVAGLYALASYAHGGAGNEQWAPRSGWWPGFGGMGGMESHMNEMHEDMERYMGQADECGYMGEWQTTTIEGVVAGVDYDGFFIIVETGEGEEYRVKVSMKYVDGDTGYLVFGPWLLTTIDVGDEIVVTVAGAMRMDGPPGMKHYEEEGAAGMAVEIEIDGKSYIHPGYLAYSLKGSQ